MDPADTTDAIRRNSLKSIAIVLAFPLVLPTILFILWLIVAIIAARRDAFVTAERTFVVSLIVMVVITLVWLPIGYLLNQWIVDRATDARLVSRTELRNVWVILDRLSTQCGIRTPALRLIETDALNAYASGMREGSYSVTVTSGLVATLEDDELEGVLAHELTHIIHHDVRLMVLAGVLVGTIPMVHDIAMKIFWGLIMGLLGIYRAMFVLLPNPAAKGLMELTYSAVYWAGRLIAYAIGLIATLCSLVLHFALSRRREFMADAGAAAMTGKPEALISALRKISGNATLDTALAAVRAMCIENSVAWFGMFSTHPPIADRIEALAQITIKSPQRGTAHEAVMEPSRVSPPPPHPGPTLPTLDPSTVARYRAILSRAQPELLDVIAREHLYRRARQTVENAQTQNPGITAEEVALARTHLEAAIEEIETDALRRRPER